MIYETMVSISKKERLLLQSSEKKIILDRPILKGLNIVSEKEIYSTKKQDSDVTLTLVKTEDKQKLVIKQVTFEGQNKALWRELNREYYVGKMFNTILGRSPRLLRCLKKGSDECNFHSFEVLMEYKGIPLNNVKLSNKQLHQIIFKLLQTLAEMEALGIAHFDLKPANILWDEKTQEISLIDFGCAIIFYDEKQKVYEPLMEKASLVRHCTPQYAPPELLKGKMTQLIPVKVDVFCFGITLAELLITNNDKRLNFSRKNSKESIKKFTKDICNLLNGQRQFQKLFQQCVHYDPQKRSNFSSLFLDFCNMFKIEKPIEKKSPEHYIKLAKEFFNKREIEIGQYFADIAIDLLGDDPEGLEMKINLEIQLLDEMLNDFLHVDIRKYINEINSIPENKLSLLTKIKKYILVERSNLMSCSSDEATRTCIRLMQEYNLKFNGIYLNWTASFTYPDYIALQVIILKQLDYSFSSREIAMSILNKLHLVYSINPICRKNNFIEVKKALERYFCPNLQNTPIKYYFCMAK